MVRMTPEQAVDLILTVPYVPGGGALAGADCWGIVELWYLHALGEDISADREDYPAGHHSLDEGLSRSPRWAPIDGAEDHCLVVMRAGRFRAGHIGVYFQGSVLHSDQAHGCVYEPISNRFIRTRITGFLKRT